MGPSAGRVLVLAAALWLGGCETSTKLTGMFGTRSDDPTTTGSVDSATNPDSLDPTTALPDDGRDAASARTLGRDPYDDLALGKKYFAAANFGLAEKHFRRAVEQHPRDAEAWVGLAAAYDRLKRFDLADRAYGQAAGIVGETPEIMNNRGFSYILRGDYRRARQTLLTAQAQAPENPYIRNNLQLLEKVQRRGKSVN